MMKRMQRLHLFHVILKVINNLFFPMELLQTICNQGRLVYFICSFFRSPYAIKCVHLDFQSKVTGRL